MPNILSNIKKITIGIIAHVDSGKTTLSEALLYLTGTIRSFGRVDKGASFLDNDSMERRRGITIYSKQARFTYGNTEFVMIDTPGHADFSAEMERTIQVLDYVILLISAADKVTGRTRELWRLISSYRVPVFVFFNKMDQPGADREYLLNSFRSAVVSETVDFTHIMSLENERDQFYDSIAMCSEEAMDSYLETGMVSDEMITHMIQNRQLFPCFFGSALRQEGVEALLTALDRYTQMPEYPQDFGARVYKILRDPDGSRLTLMKITGGELKAKTLLPDETKKTGDTGETPGFAAEGEASKINQIRLYNGNKYVSADCVKAGDVCAVTGLKNSYAGQGFGMERQVIMPLLTPILSYRVIIEDNTDPVKAYGCFKTIEEGNPELKAQWNEDKQEISVCVMGKVQLEILTSLLEERFGIRTSFDTGEVMYRETIASPVIGAGHFEPLRHYAEAVLLMQPLPRGAGLLFDSAVKTERLSRNWQRLILTHLAERTHKGVLTGSPITDMRITVISGRSHLKHTEGGDFRQAVYRAVRQGLMMAENVLLEPYYRFSLDIPSSNIGKAMTDLDMMGAEFGSPEISSRQDMCTISGRASVSAIKDYPAEISAYTKGAGHITFYNDGYDTCKNAADVIAVKGYDPLSDMRHTPDSVFCANGSGYIVPFDEVYDHLDVSPADFLEGIQSADSSASEEYFSGDNEGTDAYKTGSAMEAARRAGLDDKKITEGRTAQKNFSIGTEEIDAIIAGISRSNSRDRKKGNTWKRKFAAPEEMAANIPSGKKDSGANVFAVEESDIVLVDGYNVIFAWQELSDLARVNIDSARDALIDVLSGFQSMIRGSVTVVFDAYRVKGHATEKMKLQDVQLIFTGEEETADQYIEKFTNENGRKMKITVVTSDSLEQIVTRGQGAMLISSRELKRLIDSLSSGLNEKYGIK